MRKSRFSEEQIIHALKEHEVGTKTADISRRLVISNQTFYRWKAKFGGLEVSDDQARQADAERHMRKLQRAVQGRMLERKLVQGSCGGPAGGPRMAT